MAPYRSPPVGECVFSSAVLLRGEYFPGDRASGQRPAGPPVSRGCPTSSAWLVDSRLGDPDEQGRVRGEVQLLYSQPGRTDAGEGEPRRRRLPVAGKPTAWAGYVSLNGKLVRGERVHRIVEVSNFKSLKD